MNFNNISFILHKPQLSENIGLCARAIKNFGFKNLLTALNDKLLLVGLSDFSLGFPFF